jgi:hypothetical protein
MKILNAAYAIPKIFLQPCSHEEAGTCVVLHADDCARSGLHKVLIMIRDTDVVGQANWTLP